MGSRPRPSTSTIAPRGGLLTVAVLVLLVTACASGGQAAGTNAAASAAATVAQQTCQQVSAVLSDGPDPGADPVGYAEAQIKPLRQIRTSDETLGKAITTLATDYSDYFSASGHGTSVTTALSSAVSAINKLCPGAGASE